MSVAILIADLGYGDSGKGSITDYICRRDNVRTVVRYNGGAQAAHNVITPGGRHHTFAQFGAGTFTGARTHLGPLMMLNPVALLEEARELEALEVESPLSLLTIDERTLVTTPYQIAMNRLREISRGQGRHGSCGLGVGETMWDHVEFDLSVRAGMFRDRPVLLAALERLRVHKATQAAALTLPDSAEARAEFAVLADTEVAAAFADVCEHVAAKARVVDPSYLSFVLADGVTVFEGAQGVLLDEWFGFHPYTTWSTTHYENAEKLLKECAFTGEVKRLGLLRGYFTRHGAGPFVTEDELLTEQIPDWHNGTARWQEHFRVGWFDVVAARYALDVVAAQGSRVDELVVTNLDRMGSRAEWPVATAYEAPDGTRPPDLFDATGRIRVGQKDDLERQERLTRFLESATPRYQVVPLEGYLDFLEEQLGLPIILVSSGPTADYKHERVYAGATV
jgi:adenylosuccinate synthase